MVTMELERLKDNLGEIKQYECLGLDELQKLDDKITAIDYMIDDENENAIIMDEIMKALKHMKVGKVAGPDRVLIRDAEWQWRQWQGFCISSLINAGKDVGDMHNQLVKNKLPQNYNKNISENLFNEEEFEEGINSYMEYDNTVRKKQRQSIIETDAMDNVNSENKQTKGISFECKVGSRADPAFEAWRVYILEHCGKKFVTKRVLLMHCRAKHGYERTDKCSYCEYTGCSAEQIKVHERLHTGEKPYRCKACGVSFHRNSNYLQHVAVHLSEKTVQCDRCPLLFKSVTLMRIHRDNRHKKSKYQYKCKVCANNFTRRRNALLHLKRMHCVDEADKVERISV
ncbi:Transcriptional repressor CTCFL [Eumeta japonica]|uniref:Transcriptional repressor CTCFL n=1 Tax=Eumeta variegata TaxID=151549 RepID=A0A4C1WWG3_EUMVA|nr:Transcriptional repressor CTCFL [Eumeta japonica]